MMGDGPTVGMIAFGPMVGVDPRVGCFPMVGFFPTVGFFPKLKGFGPKPRLCLLGNDTEVVPT